ncbi:hypothetical protein LWM68_15020 [Niabella sp. W65]|nr:hypothetical protein [Niabella sp. W65]MCH7363956.1 hypothetical protein [Niabella sp. W65]ULT39847.1 hypothetical protein KRR40_33820 [Niabella sp. I65]
MDGSIIGVQTSDRIFFIYCHPSFDRLEITDIAEAGVRVTYYILWGIGVLGYLLMGVIFLSFSKIHQR